MKFIGNPKILEDSWTVDLRKSHKQKGRNMWIKTENKERIVNLKEWSQIGIFRTETKEEGVKHVVGVTGNYCGVTAIRTFVYKEDAEKYLDELLQKLNDED